MANKKIDIKEFTQKGYLQEVNRRFLHPLGLALEVVINDDGSYELGDIWDYRHAPQGITFVTGLIDQKKIDFVEGEFKEKVTERYNKKGYMIQGAKDKG